MRDTLSHYRPGTPADIENGVSGVAGSKQLNTGRIYFYTLTMLGLATLAGCSSASTTSPPQLQSNAAPPVVGGYSSPTRTGVQASPRLVRTGRIIPRGGGVYKVGKPYRIAGKLYVPREDQFYDRTGKASWYGADFHGRKTANGEIFDMTAMTAAHPTLPLQYTVTSTTKKTAGRSSCGSSIAALMPTNGLLISRGPWPERWILKIKA